MTEVNYSPEAYRQYQRTQERISNWAGDTARVSHKYQNPFLPRPEAELRANEFYNPKSSSSSRTSSTSSSKRHSPRKTPQRSQTMASPLGEQDRYRSPPRSKTMGALVSPDDSISQVGIPTTSHRTRARSHSPSRHRSGRSSRHHQRTATYVVHQPQPQPQPAYSYMYGNMAYVQSPGVVQSPVVQSPASGGYVQAPAYFQAQPAAQPQTYVVYPSTDKRVQVVYPDTQPKPSPGGGGGFFSRMFSKSGSGSGRSRSVDPSRSRR
ncbi:hypothetical protein MKEN_00757200 [Mycena kentingensis (nom. inval.)]|nr:hypothetical protein MKEN_00757200 [Mycena kentingensis (nom. inval.)]